MLLLPGLLLGRMPSLPLLLDLLSLRRYDFAVVVVVFGADVVAAPVCEY
jgi:hypothetical protein